MDIAGTVWVDWIIYSSAVRSVTSTELLLVSRNLIERDEGQTFTKSQVMRACAISTTAAAHRLAAPVSDGCACRITVRAIALVGPGFVRH
jgi:hypothetical protein